MCLNIEDKSIISIAKYILNNIYQFLYNPIYQMQAEETNKNLTKLEISDHFAKIFEQEQNTFCFQCRKKSRQWAETKHAIILCLSCAANYKDLGKVVQVKSISLDLWAEPQLGALKIGGNKRFKEFLMKYQLDQAEPKVFLRSQAAHYYTQMLIKEISGQAIDPEPSLEIGRMPFKANIPVTEMSPDELLDEAKEKLVWFGGKTKEYGSKAYGAVHQKVTSGQLKEDAKKAGEKINETAKGIWDFMKSKYKELEKKDNNGPKQEEKPREPDNM